MSTSSRIDTSAAAMKRAAQKVAGDTPISQAMEALVRLGYGVRGVVYAVIGLLALKVSLGDGGAFTDPQGAIAALGRSALGGVALYGILAGLIGYGLWGLARGIFDLLHKGTDAKGIAARLGFAISGISYLLLSWGTYRLIQGAAAQNGGQTAQLQQTTGTLLSKPWGAWVVGLGAVVIMGVGLLQIYRGIHRDFDEQFEVYALNSGQRTWISRLGRFGMSARGLVFTLIGLFLFLAAYHNDPSRAQGIDRVLASLLQQPYGPWLLAVVALGLIAFGVYSALSGVWLRLKR